MSAVFQALLPAGIPLHPYCDIVTKQLPLTRHIVLVGVCAGQQTDDIWRLSEGSLLRNNVGYWRASKHRLIEPDEANRQLWVEAGQDAKWELFSPSSYSTGPQASLHTRIRKVRTKAASCCPDDVEFITPLLTTDYIGGSNPGGGDHRISPFLKEV